MKKGVVLFLTVLLAACISGCSGPSGLPGLTAAVKVKVPRSMEVFQTEEETEQDTETSSESGLPEVNREALGKMIDIPETLLLKEADIEIYVNGYIPDNNLSIFGKGPAFRLRCVNHTDKPLLFTVANASVNGFEMNNFCAVTVDPQSEAEDVLFTYNFDYEFLEIDVPNELEAWFVIFEAENPDVRYLLADPVTAILPGESANALDDTTGKILYDQNGIRLVLFDEVRILKSYFGNLNLIHALAVNEADTTIRVESEDFCVNETLPQNASILVRPGKKGLLTFLISMSDLEEAGMSTVESAGGSFRISRIEDITAKEWETTEIACLDSVTMAVHPEEESPGFVIMDQDGIKLTMGSLYYDWYLGGSPGASLTAENHTEKERNIAAADIYINGFRYKDYIGFMSVKQGETASTDDNLPGLDSFMEEYGIGEIKTITARGRYNAEDHVYFDEDYIYGPFVRMTLDGTGEAVFQKPDALFLTETQGVRFSLVSFGTETGVLGNIDNVLHLMIENQSETDVLLTRTDKVWGNDRVAVPSGCCAIEPFDLNLPDKTFSGVDTVRFALNLTDLSNGKSLENELAFILEFE